MAESRFGLLDTTCTAGMKLVSADQQPHDPHVKHRQASWLAARELGFIIVTAGRSACKGVVPYISLRSGVLGRRTICVTVPGARRPDRAGIILMLENGTKKGPRVYKIKKNNSAEITPSHTVIPNTVLCHHLNPRGTSRRPCPCPSAIRRIMS